GIFGSRPLDRDRVAQGKALRRSNPGRRFRIGRLRTFGRTGGGGTSPGMVSRGGARRTWPKSAAPGSIRRGFGSRTDYAPCVVHLWHKRVMGRLKAARASATAGLRGKSLPAGTS